MYKLHVQPLTEFDRTVYICTPLPPLSGARSVGWFTGGLISRRHGLSDEVDVLMDDDGVVRMNLDVVVGLGFLNPP